MPRVSQPETSPVGGHGTTTRLPSVARCAKAYCQTALATRPSVSSFARCTLGRDQVARQRRGEPALRAERQPLQRHVRAASSIRCRSSASLSISGSFVVISPSTTVLSGGTNRSGAKLPARGVSYSSSSALHLQVAEQLLGDRIVAALHRPHAAVVAAAQVQAERHVGEARRAVVVVDHLAEPGVVLIPSFGSCPRPPRSPGACSAARRAARTHAGPTQLPHQRRAQPQRVRHVLVAVGVGLVGDARHPEHAGVAEARQRRLERPRRVLRAGTPTRAAAGSASARAGRSPPAAAAAPGWPRRPP